MDRKLLGVACQSLELAFLSEWKPSFHLKTAQEAFLEGGSDRKLTTELSEALYFSTDDFARAKTTKKNSAHGLDLEIKSLEQEKLIKLMDKSILKDGVIEKQDSLPIPKSKNQLKKERQLKASETAGDKWFKLGTKDVDEDTQMDLQFLQLRNFTDPKKFMKQKELEIPKHFEVGHVVGQAADFFSEGRSKKKFSKKHFVDDLLENQEYKKYAKRKYTEIQETKNRAKRRRTS